MFGDNVGDVIALRYATGDTARIKHGMNMNNMRAASGVYFLKATVNGKTKMNKIMLVR